jgi:hypothetical protein
VHDVVPAVDVEDAEDAVAHRLVFRERRLVEEPDDPGDHEDRTEQAGVEPGG